MTKSTSNAPHLHTTSVGVRAATPRAPRSSRSLPPGVPRGPYLIRSSGRLFSITEKAIRTYCEEYGLGEGVTFSFEECLQHIAMELAEALKGRPVSVSRRTPAVRVQSRNLVFTLIGSSVASIRISLKYSSRSKSSPQSSIVEELIPE